MSWQSELQQLDIALAAGQVSADEYRQRRDQLLAQASGQSAPESAPAQAGPPPQAQQPGQPTAGDGQQGVNSGQPVPSPAHQQPQPGQPPHAQGQPQQGQPQGSSPFPPAFRWQRQEDANSATSVMRPVGDPGAAGQQRPGDADRTQVVSGDSGGERTQIVRGYTGPGTPPPGFPGPGTPPPGFPQQQQQHPQQQGYPQQQGNPWSSQPPAGDFSPPWGNENDLPANFGNATWLRQGPEVFNDAPSGKKSKVLIIVASVVVVLLIAGGVFYFATKPGSGTTPVAQGKHTPTRTKTTPPKPKPTPVHPDEPLLDQIPPVVGTVNTRGQLIDTSDLLKMGVNDQTAVDLLTQAGVDQVAWRAGSKAADQYGPTPDYFSVTVIPQDTPDAADTLARQLQHYQEDSGFTAVRQTLPGVPPTIAFEQNNAPKLSIDRGLWVCGDDVIWVNVVQQPPTNQQALATSFQREIVSLTQSFPAQ
jgi:flagellar basal body-associated protein FliL